MLHRYLTTVNGYFLLSSNVSFHYNNTGPQPMANFTPTTVPLIVQEDTLHRAIRSLLSNLSVWIQRRWLCNVLRRSLDYCSAAELQYSGLHLQSPTVHVAVTETGRDNLRSRSQFRSSMMLSHPMDSCNDECLCRLSCINHSSSR